MSHMEMSPVTHGGLSHVAHDSLMRCQPSRQILQRSHVTHTYTRCHTYIHLRTTYVRAWRSYEKNMAHRFQMYVSVTMNRSSQMHICVTWLHLSRQMRDKNPNGWRESTPRAKCNAALKSTRRLRRRLQRSSQTPKHGTYTYFCVTTATQLSKLCICDKNVNYLYAAQRVIAQRKLRFWRQMRDWLIDTSLKERIRTYNSDLDGKCEAALECMCAMTQFYTRRDSPIYLTCLICTWLIWRSECARRTQISTPNAKLLSNATPTLLNKTRCVSEWVVAHM